MGSKCFFDEASCAEVFGEDLEFYVSLSLIDDRFIRMWSRFEKSGELMPSKIHVQFISETLTELMEKTNATEQIPKPAKALVGSLPRELNPGINDDGSFSSK